MYMIGDIAEFARKGRRKGAKDRRPRRRRIKTWVTTGPLGLRLRKGPALAAPLGPDGKVDTVAAARAFYDREKKAGRF